MDREIEQYRLFCLDMSGAIATTFWIEAAGDAQAIALAKNETHAGVLCELWLRNRFVATFRPVKQA